MRKLITMAMVLVAITCIITINYCPNHTGWHMGHVLDSKYDRYCNNCGAEMHHNF